jgi:hypothetical protein
MDTPVPQCRSPDFEQRLIRIETRLSKLMIHLGLEPDGAPARRVNSAPSSTTTQRRTNHG